MSGFYTAQRFGGVEGRSQQREDRLRRAIAPRPGSHRRGIVAQAPAHRVVAEQVEHRPAEFRTDALPFGGWKASGLGLQALDAFRRSKRVAIDHKPVRQDGWYPYPATGFVRPAAASTSDPAGGTSGRLASH
ncbi:hypothetical protein ACSBOB_31365 [Mesorhizobium sp. ASY16-5R]|uniref:hypothetical protein n=1 Tax=Mesorhizobium sp. ASY16-5R TaxID=3445772 RepID=UPI003F9F603E